MEKALISILILAINLDILLSAEKENVASIEIFNDSLSSDTQNISKRSILNYNSIRPQHEQPGSKFHSQNIYHPIIRLPHIYKSNDKPNIEKVHLLPHKEEFDDMLKNIPQLQSSPSIERSHPDTPIIVKEELDNHPPHPANSLIHGNSEDIWPHPLHDDIQKVTNERRLPLNQPVLSELHTGDANNILDAKREGDELSKISNAIEHREGINPFKYFDYDDVDNHDRHNIFDNNEKDVAYEGKYVKDEMQYIHPYMSHRQNAETNDRFYKERLPEKAESNAHENLEGHEMLRPLQNKYEELPIVTEGIKSSNEETGHPNSFKTEDLSSHKNSVFKLLEKNYDLLKVNGQIPQNNEHVDTFSNMGYHYGNIKENLEDHYSNDVKTQINSETGMIKHLNDDEFQMKQVTDPVEIVYSKQFDEPSIDKAKSASENKGAEEIASTEYRQDKVNFDGVLSDEHSLSYLNFTNQDFNNYEETDGPAMTKFVPSVHTFPNAQKNRQPDDIYYPTSNSNFEESDYENCEYNEYDSAPIFADRHNPSMYITCSSYGVPIRLPCAPSTFFSDALKACIPEGFVDSSCGSRCANGECIFNTMQSRHVCHCNMGYTGENCTQKIDYCKEFGHNCGQGKCINQVGTYVCDCGHGLVGQSCDKATPVPCSTQFIHEGGRLDKRTYHPFGTNHTAYITCFTKDSFVVRRCKDGQFWDQSALACVNHKPKEVKPGCEQYPCLFGGQCISDPSKPEQYKCICTSGYYGRNCEYVVDNCKPNPCNGHPCVNIANSPGYYCECPNKIYDDCCCNEIENRCHLKTHGGFYAERDGMFVHCTPDGRGFIKRCPDGFGFDEKKLTCERYYKIRGKPINSQYILNEQQVPIIKRDKLLDSNNLRALEDHQLRNDAYEENHVPDTTTPLPVDL